VHRVLVQFPRGVTAASCFEPRFAKPVGSALTHCFLEADPSLDYELVPLCVEAEDDEVIAVDREDSPHLMEGGGSVHGQQCLLGAAVVVDLVTAGVDVGHGLIFRLRGSLETEQATVCGSLVLLSHEGPEASLQQS